MSSAATGSIFAKIVAGQIPCHRVFESEHVFAFLDINPLAVGHTLVVPRRPVEQLHELSEDEAAELGRVLPMLARRVMAACGAEAYNILQNNGRAAGQEVPYVHFHIIPRRSGDGLGYRWNPRGATKEELAALAAKLSQQ